MSFTCSEFPGQFFGSLEELKNLQASKKKVLLKMYKPVIVRVEETTLISE